MACRGLGSRSGLGLGRGCNSGGTVRGGGCDRGTRARRSSCASTSSRSSRSSCGAQGRAAAVIGRTRASAGAAPCAAWFGARCVGGRCGGYAREGYRGLHLGLGEELALLHGVDPEDEVILTCTTRSRACSAAPFSLPRARWAAAHLEGGRARLLLAARACPPGTCAGRSRAPQAAPPARNRTPC